MENLKTLGFIKREFSKPASRTGGGFKRGIQAQLQEGGRQIPSRGTSGVSHCGLAIYILKSILRQKKKYGNSNISPCNDIIFFKKKNPLNGTKILQDIITLRTNLKFQHKPKYHLSNILI